MFGPGIISELIFEYTFLSSTSSERLMYAQYTSCDQGHINILVNSYVEQNIVFLSKMIKMRKYFFDIFWQDFFVVS